MATVCLPFSGPLLSIKNQEARRYFRPRGNKPITYGTEHHPEWSLNLSYSYNGGAAIPVITNQSIAASNGTIPANFHLGFRAAPAAPAMCTDDHLLQGDHDSTPAVDLDRRQR